MSDETGLLFKIYKGKVKSVKEYGAFVTIPENASQGLVHRSQISSANVSDASEVLQVGDSIWFKVIGIKDGKISLSMKVVDQGTGADLDPNGVQIQQDEKHRKERGGKSKNEKIELGAILKTKCAKCGVEGHLKKDCFFNPGGKTYELLEDEPVDKKIFGTEEDLRKRTQEFDTLKRKPEENSDDDDRGMPVHKKVKREKEKAVKRKKKRKKEKKKRKGKKEKKKRRKSTSSSDSSSTD